jgi:plasmid maintenance system antidote protein VapI
VKKLVLILLVLSGVEGPALLSAKSLWEDGGNLYRTDVKPGDILRVRFSEKTLMKYKLEQKTTRNDDTKGRRGSGEIFSFFPDAAVAASDRTEGRNELTIQNEKNFTMPAKVVDADSNTLHLQGYTTSLLNGEVLRIEVSGECAISRVSGDRSVTSTDLYDLGFKVAGQPPTNSRVFTEEDVLYKTNFTEITNATTIATNTNGQLVTNTTRVTNAAAFKLEFAGIADRKKREILVNYLNAIVNALFRD